MESGTVIMFELMVVYGVVWFAWFGFVSMYKQACVAPLFY